MLLLENELKKQEEMQDTVESKKKKTRAKDKIKGWRKKLAQSYINSFFKRITYRQSLAELADVWQP